MTDETRLLKKQYLPYADANISVALQHALAKELPLVAIARTGDLAHIFAFAGLKRSEDEPWIPPNEDMEGCQTPCRDDETKFCGSGDHYKDVKEGRVWALYVTGHNLQGMLA